MSNVVPIFLDTQISINELQHSEFLEIFFAILIMLLHFCLIAEEMSIDVIRVYSGVLMTSLNSAGVHVSLLKLTENEDAFIRCLDAETTAPCWPGCSYSISSTVSRTLSEESKRTTAEKIGLSLGIREQHLTKLCLESACAAIVKQEAHLNELDRGCGDGDCGSTLKRLADGKTIGSHKKLTYH